MAILAVDEVWLREPRLLVPGMQPVENVRPTDSRLVSLIVAPRTTDLVTGAVATTNTSEIHSVATGRRFRRITSEYTAWPVPPRFVGAGEVTFICVGRTPSNVSGAAIFGIGVPGYYGLLCGYINSGGALLCYVKNGSTSISADFGTGYTNNDARIAMRWKAGGYLESWLSISPYSSVKYAISASTLTGTVATNNLSYTMMPFTSTNYGSQLEMAALYKSYLGDAEILSLLSNPYQLVVPA